MAGLWCEQRPQWLVANIVRGDRRIRSGCANNVRERCVSAPPNHPAPFQMERSWHPPCAFFAAKRIDSAIVCRQGKANARVIPLGNK